jgi:hypothetical protein
MPKIEFEPLKTDIDTKEGVYTREDAERDLDIIRTQTYHYISDMTAANDAAIEAMLHGKERPSCPPELLRAHPEEKQSTGKRKKFNSPNQKRN